MLLSVHTAPPPSAAGVHREPLTIGLTDCSTPSSTPCFVHQNSLLAPTEDDPVCLYNSFTDVIGSVSCSRGRESTGHVGVAQGNSGIEIHVRLALVPILLLLRLLPDAGCRGAWDDEGLDCEGCRSSDA